MSGVEATYLRVSTGQLITSSINTLTISSGTTYARTLSTANLYADYVKGDGSQLSNVPFTPQAYSIPWNAMQPYGGLAIQSGNWYLDNVAASNISTSSLTTVHGTIATLTSRVICTFFLSTNSTKAIFNDFDTQIGRIQLVESSLMAYLSTANMDVGATNINLITSKYGQFSSISTGVWDAGNILFSSLSLFDKALQIDNVITMSSGILLLNNNDYLASTLTTSNFSTSFDFLFNGIVYTASTLHSFSTATASNVSTLNTNHLSTISTFSTAISRNFITLTTNLISSVSSLSTVTGLNFTNLSTVSGSNLSTTTTSILSTFSSLSTVTGLNVSTLSSLTLSLQIGASTLSTVTGSNQSTFYTNLQSTVTGLGSLGYVSTTQLHSTVTGLGSLGYISTTQLQSTVTGLGFYYISTLTVNPSSLTGLGTLGYVSTTQLQSTVRGLGAVGYVSTTQLQSTVTGLGSLGYISTPGVNFNYINSTVTGLGTLGYVSTTQLQSTITGLGSLGYISTLGVNSNYINSTVTGLGTLGYVSTTQLQSTITGLGSLGYISTLGVNSNYINSTVTGLGTLGYVSTASLTSSLAGLGSLGYLSTASVTPSSLTGLGTLGYVSTASLQSSLTGLGTLGYVSTSYLQSTITGLGSLGYLSTSGTSSDYINSTVTGLGTLGYVSTASLQSSLTGLGSLGYISTALVTPSSLTGLGTLGYVSTASLQSSLEGLGSLGYISTALVTPSSLTGLGTLGYVSTASLQSSLTGLGSLGYISTALVTPSSLTGLGTLGYVSTASLQSSLTGLGSLGYLSTALVTPSSLTGLGTLGYVSTASLQSTVRGLGSLGYISSVTRIENLSVSTLYVSTITLYDTTTYTSSYINFTSSFLYFNSSIMAGSRVAPSQLVTFSSYSPNLTSLEVWVDAADPYGTGVRPLDGEIVGTFIDKSLSNSVISFSGNKYYSAASNSIVFSNSFMIGMYTALPTNITVNSGSLFFVTSFGNVTSVYMNMILSPNAYILFENDIIVNKYNGVNITSNVAPFSTYTTLNIIGFLWNSTESYIYINGNAGPIGGGMTSMTFSSRQPIFLMNADPFTMSEILIYDTYLSTTERKNIEGYLANKWMLTSLLPPGHPGLPQPFTPLNIYRNLFLWLDGADPLGTGTPPANGTVISTWYDKSSKNNSVTSAYNTITYSSASNSLVKTFGGPNNNTSFSDIYTYNNNGTLKSRSIFLVASITSPSSYTVEFYDRSDNNANRKYRYSKDDSTFSIYKISDDNYYASNATPITPGARFLVEFTETSSQSYVYINGVPGPVGLGINPSPEGGTQRLFQLLYGTVSEFLMFTVVLADSDRQKIEGYLAWKWGIQTSLSPSHPYYSVSPKSPSIFS